MKNYCRRHARVLEAKVLVSFRVSKIATGKRPLILSFPVKIHRARGGKFEKHSGKPGGMKLDMLHKYILWLNVCEIEAHFTGESVVSGGCIRLVHTKYQIKHKYFTTLYIYFHRSIMYFVTITFTGFHSRLTSCYSEKILIEILRFFFSHRCKTISTEIEINYFPICNKKIQDYRRIDLL